MRVRACVCAYVRACVRACARVCVCVCVRARARATPRATRATRAYVYVCRLLQNCMTKFIFRFRVKYNKRDISAISTSGVPEKVSVRAVD